MLDFRKQFQEIIEQSYIPFNIDKAATSDVWSNCLLYTSDAADE